MICKIFNKLLSFLILIIFTYTSCHNSFFNYLPNEADKYKLEVGRGTPYYVYLDSEYNPILENITINDLDPGKTALLVHDNPLAENVIVFAETMPYGSVVQIIDVKSKNKLSFYYNQNNNFPTHLFIETEGEQFAAFLSEYNYEKQTFSIFFEEYGEYSSFDNVVLNKGVLAYHIEDKTLTKNQNIRIQNMYTALGLYVSLNHIIDSDSEIYFFFSKLKSNIAKAFAIISMVAFAIACICAAPIVIAGVSLLIPGTTLTSMIFLGVSVAAGFAAFMAEKLYVENIPENGIEHKILVNILLDDDKIVDNYFYIDINNSIELDINITFTDERMEVYYFFYDPITKSMFDLLNRYLFKFEINSTDVNYNNGILTKGSNNIRITRNNLLGYIENGEICVLLVFNFNNVIVKDKKVNERITYNENGLEINDFYCYPITITAKDL